ncbi:helix-turn-helix domain containing protein [Pontiellaceae bacterium B12219]|nr:helix-turn-helix domain containing protein [Pontiellaceae bacterium B12219]
MKTREIGDSTKEKIINTAGILAADMGMDNVSTRAIADYSGENIGSIHYHFGGKSGLFEAVALGAVHGCREQEFYGLIESLDESSTPEQLSNVVRVMVSGTITDLFRSDRPIWHSQVIYQLLQRDDALYEIFRDKLMDPKIEAMGKFLRLLNPSVSKEEIIIHTAAIQMPIFSHANYMKALLKQLGMKRYSEEYLQTLENTLVKQTQLLLGLPQD